MDEIVVSTPRRVLLLLLMSVLLFPGFALALSTNMQLETMVRGFERDIPSKGSSQVMPGYGFLTFDAKDLTSTGLSLHGYGWGRYDMADSEFFGSQGDGELLYGYLEYRKKFSTLRARLGRMHIFEGVANETVDGLWAAGDVSPKVSLSGYAGQPVALSAFETRSGDSIFGGRASYHGGDKYDLGLSFKISDNNSNAADRLIGADLSWALPKDMSLFGYSKFNTEESSFAEHSWELRIPYDVFTFKPFIQYFDYDSYFGTGDKAARPFRNLANSGESLGILGMDTFWRKTEELNLGAKIKLYGYDKNDSSMYLSMLATLIGEEHTQSGVELGYMKGEAANNNYLLLRLYTYQDQLPEKYWVAFLSADLVYALYDKPIYGEDSSLFLSLGAGKHVWNDALDLKLSGDYSRDPYYTSDLRGMLSATYHFGGGL